MTIGLRPKDGEAICKCLKCSKFSKLGQVIIMNDSLFETLVATQNLGSYLRPSVMSFIVMNTIPL